MKRIIILFLSVLMISCVQPVKVGNLTINKPTYRFAIIGDYGNKSFIEKWVGDDMKLNDVKSVMTVGDNIYPDGSSGYDSHVGDFFSHWITLPRANFWPAIGNHDWNGVNGILPYTNFFHLPRYYDVDIDDRHMIHLYVLDSDEREPDGIGWNSNQAKWFRNAVQKNKGKSCFQIVTFHHPAASTKIDQSSFCDGCAPVNKMDWPFKESGIDAVFSGHAHWGERYTNGGMNFWTVGNSTNNLDLDNFKRDDRSKYFASKSGYLLGEVGPGWMAVAFKFLNEKNVEDLIRFEKECPITF